MRGIACYIVLLSKCNCWQVHQFSKRFYGNGVGGVHIEEGTNLVFAHQMFSLCGR